MDDLKVAAVCMRSRVGRVKENLDRMDSLVSEAGASGADIVCFPELSVTGYTLRDPEKICTSQEADLSVEWLIGAARKTGALVVAGALEFSEGQRPYITQIAAGPEGMISRYRKTHLSPAEKGVYRPGQEIGVFARGGTTFGLQLCYEAHFPELSTIMALEGAEVVLFPHASPRGNPQEKSESWIRHLQARAFDNGVYVVACNQVGENGEGYSFPGVALVLDPGGKILARYTGDKETILFSTLDAQKLEEIRNHRMRYFIPHRRPELYRLITKIKENPV